MCTDSRSDLGKLKKMLSSRLRDGFFALPTNKSWLGNITSTADHHLSLRPSPMPLTPRNDFEIILHPLQQFYYTTFVYGIIIEGWRHCAKTWACATHASPQFPGPKSSRPLKPQWYIVAPDWSCWLTQATASLLFSSSISYKVLNSKLIHLFDQQSYQETCTSQGTLLPWNIFTNSPSVWNMTTYIPNLHKGSVREMLTWILDNIKSANSFFLLGNFSAALQGFTWGVEDDTLVPEFVCFISCSWDIPPSVVCVKIREIFVFFQTVRGGPASPRTKLA